MCIEVYVSLLFGLMCGGINVSITTANKAKRLKLMLSLESACLKTQARP
jgi:hypothetical protein